MLNARGRLNRLSEAGFRKDTHEPVLSSFHTRYTGGDNENSGANGIPFIGPIKGKNCSIDTNTVEVEPTLYVCNVFTADICTHDRMSF